MLGGVWLGMGIIDVVNGIFDLFVVNVGLNMIFYEILGICSDVLIVVIMVNLLFVVVFVVDKMSGCVFLIVNFINILFVGGILLWDFESGIDGGGGFVVFYIFVVVGCYIVLLIFIDVNGC